MTLMFHVPRAKSAPKKMRTRPGRRPDLDELCRAGLNALTGIVWRDGSQVVCLEASKNYGTPSRMIWVERVTDGEFDASAWGDTGVDFG